MQTQGTCDAVREHMFCGTPDYSGQLITQYAQCQAAKDSIVNATPDHDRAAEFDERSAIMDEFISVSNLYSLLVRGYSHVSSHPPVTELQ